MNEATPTLKHLLEAALLASGRPLEEGELIRLLESGLERTVGQEEFDACLNELIHEYELRGLSLRRVASGLRIEIRPAFVRALHGLWDPKPTRYSRALLETLAIMAYRQPVTRGEIEQIRGVSVASSILKTLEERGWIHIVGHREVPGRPALYATTRQFLDYFGLKSLEDLPPLEQVGDLIPTELRLDFGESEPIGLIGMPEADELEVHEPPAEETPERS
ncbi:MAG: SMC-Scp complex subunit ScpB [Gammaproteobacteria bacterium]